MGLEPTAFSFRSRGLPVSQTASKNPVDKNTMLGIRRIETPKATIMKTGFMGNVPYVVAVVAFVAAG